MNSKVLRSLIALIVSIVVIVAMIACPTDSGDDDESNEAIAALAADDALMESTLDGATVTVTLTDATYMASLVTSQFVLNTTLTGLTLASVARESDTVAALTLAYDGTNFDGDASLTVTVAANAQSGSAALTTGALSIADDVLVPVVSAALTSAALREDALTGATLAITLTNGSYVASLATSQFTLNGAPSGLTIGLVDRTSDTVATLTLAFDGTNFDTNVTNLSVTVDASAILGLDQPIMTNTTTIEAFDESSVGATLAVSTASSPLTEANLNNGQLTVTLRNASYAASLTTSQFTPNGAPTGLTVGSVDRGSDTVATLTLTYDDTDFDSDITGLTVTVAAAALGTQNLPITSNQISITAISDITATLSLSDAIATTFEEGDPATVTIQIAIVGATVTPAPIELPIGLVIAGDAATDSDYTLSAIPPSSLPTNATTPLTIMAGENRAAITVTANDDVDTTNETLTLTLGAPTGGAKDFIITLGTPITTVITLDDNDNPAENARIVATVPTTVEGSATGGQFTISLDGVTPTGGVRVFFVIGDGADSTDWTPPTNNYVEIADTERSATVDVLSKQDDDEVDETITLTLMGVTDSAGGVLSSPIAASGSATVTIDDDDAASVRVTAIDADASEAFPLENVGVFRFELVNLNERQQAATRRRIIFNNSNLVLAIPPVVHNNKAFPSDYDLSYDGSVLGGIFFVVPGGGTPRQLPTTGFIGGSLTQFDFTVRPVDDTLLEESDELVVFGYRVDFEGTSIPSIGGVVDGSEPGSFVTIAADSGGPVIRIGTDGSNESLTDTAPFGEPVSAHNFDDFNPRVTNIPARFATIRFNLSGSARAITPEGFNPPPGEIQISRLALSVQTPGDYALRAPYGGSTFVYAVIADDGRSGTIDLDTALLVLGRPRGEIALNNDAIAEGDETIVIEFTGATFRDGEGNELPQHEITLDQSASNYAELYRIEASIADDDGTGATGLTSFAPATSEISEDGATSTNLTVTLNGVATISVDGVPTQDGVSIPYTISGVDAADLSSHTTLGGMLDIAGRTGRITVTAEDDGVIEGDETLTVTLTPGAYGSVTIGSGESVEVTILDDDDDEATGVSSFGVSDSTIPEDGGTSAVFTLILDGLAATGGVDIPYTITGDVDVADLSSPTSLTGTIPIAAGMTTGMLTVTADDDGVIEGDEMLTVTLTPGAYNGVTIGSESVSVTILDDDEATGVSSFGVSDSTILEDGGTSAVFTLILDGPAATGGVDIPYTITGTGVDAADLSSHASLTGTIPIAAGMTTGMLTVTAQDDSDIEGDETLTVTLTPGAYNGVMVGAGRTADTTITDDD